MNHHTWDAYSKSYLNIQKNPATFQLTLMNMLRFEQADEILDAGCAGGQLHQYILQQRKKNCKLTACDFSMEMVKLASARMLKFLNNPLDGAISEISAQEIENVDLNSPLFEQNKYKVFQGDVQSLPQLNDNQFDIYISNMVIHLVENKDLALQEAFRVLKPGGKIGIVIPVVSGNLLMSTLTKCFIQAGLIKDMPFKPTDIETREDIINFLYKHGFKEIVCWNQTIPFDLFDIDDNYIFPQFREILDKASKEQVDQFYSLYKSEVQNRLNLNLPFTVEALSLIAKKPL
ncbi:unnamed protein product [Paramecium pentaurelia]|uniref:Methyltransferase type 11 domain-containing protein n=1 Tax=Paramecium pentaurelia TaxID=43138 RepID=A0A8S1S2G4_9CILI|nr:unnamed protein product [Paramecium pentaurelia]